MLQHKYFFSEHEDVITSIRRSEQDFHKKHAPLQANYLFCNSFMMNKIANYLLNDAPLETTIYTFDAHEEDDCEKLDSGALTCGMELFNGKVDFEANYQVAKHSKNAFLYGLGSVCDDDLFLVRDDSLSNRVLILKYIPDNDNDDDDEEEDIVFSPDDKRIYTIA